MRPPTRLLIPALLLTAVAAGVVLLAQNGGDTPPPAPPPTRNIEIAEDSEIGTLSASPGVQREDAGSPELSRRIADEGDRTGREHPQGVRGLVVGSEGQPLPDLPVFLLESVQNNPIWRWQALQHGVQFPPAAQGRTATDGSFALGIQEGAEKRYELRVLSEVFADHTVPDITIQSGDWFDVGLVTLRRGTVLRGRVTIEGTELPVPGARVTVHAPNTFEDIAQYGLPGREQGLSAEVDASGYYLIRNAPATGVVHVSAVAPGFARVKQTNVRVGSDGIEEVHFKLPPGLTIQGAVTDARGAAVPDAMITASAVSSENPQTEQVFTDRAGNFEIPGLREGLYQLTAAASDHQSRTEQGIAAGTLGLQLILEKKAIARVRVLDDQGGPLTRYALNVRRYFPHNGGQIGTVMNVPQQNIRATDLEDHVATVKGLDDGTYVFQVEADGYAKTLSEPFEIGRGGDDPLVVVQMTRGATLVGSVTDARGRPITGATVCTQADGLIDNPFYRMVASMVPDKVTVARVVTDDQGRYRLENLAFGDYQILVEHEHWCEAMVTGLHLQDPARVEVPPVALDRGTLVHGLASVNGTAAGQVRVEVSTPPAQAEGPQDPALPQQRPFHAEAVSENTGRFVLPKRLPPGTYEIKGAQQTEGGVFLRLLQHKQTAHIFRVSAGQEEYEHNINIIVDR